MATIQRNRGHQAVRVLVKRLAEVYRPQKIILFGSYCRGQATDDSDIDLLIIKDTPEAFFQRLATVRGIVAGLHPGLPFGPVVLTPAELDERVKAGDQFIEAILRDGQVLYAA